MKRSPMRRGELPKGHKVVRLGRWRTRNPKGLKGGRRR